MEDERSKKLAAGRDRLAKFQKKKKKKKKEPKSDTFKANGDTSIVNTSTSFLEETPDGGDSVDEFSAGSSDLLGSNSDILSSLSEIDQRSIGTDDLCQDSDTSQLDAEVARVELAEARTRIHQLEESLLGKQTALDLLQNELSQMRSSLNNNTDNSDSSSQNINKNEATTINSSGQEAELRAALEQYNIKIQEFQQALSQRDQVIQQLTANVQTVIQSRDAVQAEATAQTNQLSQYIQTLQDQLQQTGEALRNQSGEQMSSLADELNMAQSQVTALQQNVADKDAIMQQLAERYAQKAQELIELSEDREELRRKSFGEIAALQEKLKDVSGDLTPREKEDSLLKLQAELDESYGSQIVMMKQQLEEKHKEELGLWKQRYDEMERIAAASSDSNLMRTELEDQLKEAKAKLGEKDAEIMKYKGDIDNLSLKLANLNNAHEKQLEELDAAHKNEIEFVREQAQKRSEEYVNELKAELSSTQDELNTSLNDLEEEKKKVQEAEDVIAEKALNSSSLQDNLTKEIGILAGELQRKDEEIQDLSKVRMTLQDQLKKLTSDQKENVAQLQSQINDLFTENSQLQKDLERLNKEKVTLEEAALDEGAIRSEIEEELKSQYEDQIDELNFAHETLLQQVRNDLICEHQVALKKVEKDYETKFQQKLENVSVSKQHEFVAELQKVQVELKAKYDREIEEKLAEERAKWSGVSSGPQSSGDQEGGPEVHRLQAEVQELSEARDALLTQVDSTTHENEALQEELLQVISEKDTLVEMASSPPEMACFSSPVEEDQMRKELEMLRDCLGNSESTKKDLEEKMSEMEDSYKVRLAEIESEKQALAEQMEEMIPQMEMIKEANKMQENLDSMTKHRNQLLTDKEELQHLLETQEKEHEGKMLELLMEKEAACSDIEKLKASLEEEKERVTSDPSAEIGELTETLSELVRLQEKASKVEVLEAEVQSLSCKLQSLEEHVSEEAGSDSDKLEELQDQLQSHQRLVTDLTDSLKAAENELELLRGSSSELAKCDTEIDALQKELESLQRENKGYLEAKENLARDLDEKEQELESFQREKKENLEAKENLARDLDEKEKELENLQREIREHFEAKENLARDLDETKKELENLQRVNKEYLEAKENLASELDEMRSELESLQRENREYFEVKENLARDLDEKEQELENLQRENREYFAAKENLARDLEEKKQKLVSLNDEMNRLDSDNKTLSDQLSGKEELQKTVETLRSEKVLLQGSITHFNEEVERLKHDLNKKEEEVSCERERYSSLENELEMLKDVGKGAYEPTQKDEEKREDVVKLEEDGGEGGEADEDRSGEVEEGVEGEQVNDQGEVQDEYESQMSSLQAKVEEEQNISKEMRAAVEEKEKEVDCLKNDLAEKVGEIEDLQCKLSEMKEINSEGEQREHNLQDAIKILERDLGIQREECEGLQKEVEVLKNDIENGGKNLAIIQSERDDLLEKVKGLEQNLKEQKGEASILEENVSQLENWKSSLLERNAILEQEFESEKANIDALIKATLDESEKGEHVGGEVLDGDGEVGEEQTGETRKKDDEIVGSSQESESKLAEISEEDNRVKHLQDEIEDLRERLQYVDRESVREKKEYDKRLMQTEAELMKSQGLRAVLEAQIKAQKNMFDEEMGRLQNELSSLLREKEELKDTLGSLKEVVELVPLVQEEVLVAEQVSGEASSLLNLKEELTSNDVDQEFEKLWQEVGKLKEESKAKEEEISKMEQETDLVLTERDSALQQQEEARIQLENLREVLEESQKENLNLKSELASIKKKFEEACVAKESPVKEEESVENISFNQKENEAGHPSGDDDSLEQGETAEVDVTPSREEELKAKLDTFKEVLEETQKENLELKSELASVKELLAEGNVTKQVPDKENLETQSVEPKESDVSTQTENEAGKEQQLSVNSVGGPEEEKVLIDNLREALEEIQKENLELKSELVSVKDLLAEGNVAKQVPDNENLETRSVEPKESNVSTQTENEAGTEQQLSVDSVEGPEEEKVLIENLREALEEIQKENLELKSELASVKDLLAEGNVAKQVPDNENLETRSVKPKESDVSSLLVNEAGTEQQVSDDSVGGPEEQKVLIKKMREALEETQRENVGLKTELTVIREELENANTGRKILSEEKGISDEQSEGEMDNKSLPEAEEEGALMTEIQGLKDELEETKEIYSKEKNLLQEALEDEKNQVASEQVPGGGKSGSAEVVRLNRMVKEKEQREKEILTEKNLQISVLQEASVRLEEEKEELLRQLKDLEELSITPTAESKEFSSPSVMNEGADYVDANLAGRLDASIAREEMLKKEKDMLLEKIAEQEEIHRRLAAEKEELQRQLCDKQRLEELLLEKDRLEQELARQKKSMESELHDIEGQLRQRENHLMREKSQLENELKQKDLLLRRWEVGYREHQLKLRNQEMLLEKQYSEQLSKVQHEFEEGRVSHLEKLRSEIEKRHAEAIARLRRDLHQEFALRESRLNESHLSDISLLKSQHNSQVQWSSY